MVVEVASMEPGHGLVVGMTGSGKSRQLANLFRQIAKQAADGAPVGCCLIDPHEKRGAGGMFSNELYDLASQPQLAEDVIDRLFIFDPTDEEYTVGFNVLQPIPGVSPSRCADAPMMAFRGIWGYGAEAARMEYILRRTLIALIETGWTLAEVPRFLELPGKQGQLSPFAQAVVEKMSNPEVRRFWREEYAQWPRNEQATWRVSTLNKIGRFLDDPQVAQVLGHRESTFGNLARVMDEGRIMLVNLSQDTLGPVNAQLMASLLVSLFSAAAPSRETTRPFYLLVDEVGWCATSALSEIVTTRRAHGLFLIGACQDLGQLEQVPNLKTDMLTNTRHQFFFRMGEPDEAEEIARLLWPLTGLDPKQSKRVWRRGPFGFTTYPDTAHTFKKPAEERDGHAHRLLKMPERALVYHDAAKGQVVPMQSVFVPDVPRTEALGYRVRALYARSALRFGVSTQRAWDALYEDRDQEIEQFIGSDADDFRPTRREKL